MVAASRASPASRPSPALQRARRAWALLQADSARSVALAGQALARAREQGDAPARAWAQLVLGYNRLYLSTPAEALATLAPLREDFERLGDRAGAILLEAGIARAWWRQGRLQEAHRHLQQLRDEGLRVLRHEQRGVLLNAIAGSHSALGDSEQAFAHMVSALHEARPSRAPGFDVVLHCNLSNELMQLGDAEAALAQVDEGLARCRRLANPRLLATLLINRVIALTELGRAREALPDLQAVRAIPADEQGRGRNASCFEVLAVAALRAGEVALGRELVAAAAMSHHEPIADESHEMAQARALLAAAEGEVEGALAVMQPLRERLLDDGTDDGLSMRVRCSGLQLLSELCEHAGRPDEALAALRAWQRCQARRSSMASRARAQAALLQTELMRLHRRLEEQEARRRDTESARAAICRPSTSSCAQGARGRAAAGRAARAGHARPADRPVQPPPPGRCAAADAGAGAARGAAAGGGHHRPRPLQGRQRPPRPCRRRPAAGGLRPTAAGRQPGSDVVCRYGGEEFCLLMPHTTAMAAAHHLGQLLQRWRTQVFEHQGRRLSGLSFTAGVCDSTRPGAGGEALLQAADQALLAAKREGRAQVRLVGP
jgi:tetratricopeptide (TPR) repeat protein